MKATCGRDGKCRTLPGKSPQPFNDADTNRAEMRTEPYWKAGIKSHEPVGTVKLTRHAGLRLRSGVSSGCHSLSDTEGLCQVSPDSVENKTRLLNV